MEKYLLEIILALGLITIISIIIILIIDKKDKMTKKDFVIKDLVNSLLEIKFEDLNKIKKVAAQYKIYKDNEYLSFDKEQENLLKNNVAAYNYIIKKHSERVKGKASNLQKGIMYEFTVALILSNIYKLKLLTDTKIIGELKDKYEIIKSKDVDVYCNSDNSVLLFHEGDPEADEDLLLVVGGFPIKIEVKSDTGTTPVAQETDLDILNKKFIVKTKDYATEKESSLEPLLDKIDPTEMKEGQNLLDKWKNDIKKFFNSIFKKKDIIIYLKNEKEGSIISGRIFPILTNEDFFNKITSIKDSEIRSGKNDYDIPDNEYSFVKEMLKDLGAIINESTNLVTFQNHSFKKRNRGNGYVINKGFNKNYIKRYIIKDTYKEENNSLSFNLKNVKWVAPILSIHIGLIEGITTQTLKDKYDKYYQNKDKKNNS
jgi:hypothetical protein